jgi:ABC-2 type transport system ATP-binding protein
MYAIQTVALNKRFGRVRAVEDVSLQVETGSVYALMGPNGAGKTTLIKLLMNLLEATSGQAAMLGSNVTHLRGQRLERLGYVSENQKMPEWMSVGEFLSYWRPFYPTWDRELETQLVERFELPHKQKIKRLSRGMKMKLALASVMAYRPKLIVLDEPLSGLDPLVRDELMKGLLEQHDETTVLISSHDLAEIDSFASHVGYMDGGALRLSEPMSVVRERFRAVEAAGTEPLMIPANLPTEWIDFTASEMSARWKEIDFDTERSPERAHAVLGEVLIRTAPITLREVFLALARTHRDAGKSIEEKYGKVEETYGKLR